MYIQELQTPLFESTPIEENLPEIPQEPQIQEEQNWTDSSTQLYFNIEDRELQLEDTPEMSMQ